MLLTLLFTCLAFIGFGEFGLSVYGSYFSTLNACLIIAMVCTFPEICTKFDVILLSYPA
jgi:hypothetical protein